MSYEEEDTCHMRRRIHVYWTTPPSGDFTYSDAHTVFLHAHTRALSLSGVRHWLSQKTYVRCKKSLPLSVCLCFALLVSFARSLARALSRSLSLACMRARAHSLAISLAVSHTLSLCPPSLPPLPPFHSRSAT
jgi:hypothetical protein